MNIRTSHDLLAVRSVPTPGFAPASVAWPRGPGIIGGTRKAQPVVVTQERDVLPHHQPRIANQPKLAVARVADLGALGSMKRTKNSAVRCKQ